jgi:hypothetical protein
VASLDKRVAENPSGREHVEAVEEAVDAWLGTDAYTISRDVDPETGDTVRRAQSIARRGQ